MGRANGTKCPAGLLRAAIDRDIRDRRDAIQRRSQLVGDITAEGVQAQERSIDVRNYPVQQLCMAVDRIVRPTRRKPAA